MGFYILGLELLCNISHFITVAARGGISNIWRGQSDVWVMEAIVEWETLSKD